MFTGIVQHVGQVKEVKKSSECANLGVALPQADIGVKIGDSVAINGVCLTATAIRSGVIYFDIIGETLQKTNLSFLRVNSRVNMEYALKANDAVSGHFVTGHIDCIGRVKKIDRGKDVSYLEITVPKKFNALIAPKGSIAINGVSLTIVDCFDNYFSVHCIPYTLQVTTLKDAKVGTQFNIEFDILAKYLLRIAPPTKPASKLSLDLLKDKGFI